MTRIGKRTRGPRPICPEHGRRHPRRNLCAADSAGPSASARRAGHARACVRAARDFVRRPQVDL